MNDERNHSSGWDDAASMVLMSGAYHQLLDAAILHLQELKARGGTGT